MTIDERAQTPSEQLARPCQIIVATDLNDCDVLLPHAIAQAKACGADLTLVHALTSAGVPALDVTGFPQLALEAYDKMDQAMAEVKAQRITCTSMITHTFFPEDYLPQAARQVNAGRLIMATHGRGRLGQITLGSVAHGLLSTMEIPIFVVGPKSCTRADHCNPKRILHPVSFSKGYQESVEFARNIAELHNAELMLMHVLDPDLSSQMNQRRTMEWAKNALDEAIPDRTTLTVPLFTHVTCGDLLEKMLNQAAAFRADWIVLGTKPVSYAPILANSAAYKLMAAAPVPVLTVPRRVRRDAAKLDAKEIPAVVG